MIKIVLGETGAKIQFVDAVRVGQSLQVPSWVAYRFIGL